MSFDALVTNPGRLRILTALAARGTETKLSDGNLATHARRLQQAGLITIHKQIREGKPVTQFDLNREGRVALEEHARLLMQALRSEPIPAAAVSHAPLAVHEEEWID
jgi:DNA-binding transcriptional ArsR family regulator